MASDYTRLTYEIRRLNKRLRTLPPDAQREINDIAARLAELRSELAQTPHAQQYKANRALKRAEGAYRYASSPYSEEQCREGEQLRNTRLALTGERRQLWLQIDRLKQRQDEVDRQLKAVSDKFKRLASAGGPSR